MWDESFLYLLVKTKDNFFAPWGERSFFGFAGDAIEFAFQPENKLSPGAHYFEYETFLAPGGKLINKGKPSGDYSYKPFKAPGKPLTWRHFPFPNVEMSHWKVFIKPTGTNGDCIYQLAIPWKALGVKKIKPGKVISFSLSVDDNDAQVKGVFIQGRKWIQWFSGIGSGKDPSKYGDLVLVK
jgi:hypothetical protein